MEVPGFCEAIFSAGTAPPPGAGAGPEPSEGVATCGSLGGSGAALVALVLAFLPTSDAAKAPAVTSLRPSTGSAFLTLVRMASIFFKMSATLGLLFETFWLSGSGLGLGLARLPAPAHR